MNYFPVTFVLVGKHVRRMYSHPVSHVGTSKRLFMQNWQSFPCQLIWHRFRIRNKRELEKHM